MKKKLFTEEEGVEEECLPERLVKEKALTEKVGVGEVEDECTY